MPVEGGVAVIAEGRVWELIRCPGTASSCPPLADSLFPPSVIAAQSGNVWV